VQGRVALGLDEFMLRLGHLKILCRVARESGGSLARIQRDMAAVLTEEIPIPAYLVPAVGRYLREKHLCRVGRCSEIGEADQSNTREYRYPDLCLDENSDESIHSNADNPADVRIWQQDLWLAEPGLRSRVGAVTVTRGKAASKTGLSHIFDWAAILDVFTASGDLTPEGQILASVATNLLRSTSRNPYIIGHERILLAYLIAAADFDVLARFTTALADAEAPIKKQDGIRHFARSMEQLAQDAEAEREITSSQQFRIIQAVRELNSPQTRLRRARGEDASSTLWHRAASRLESYVDLGLLEKGVRDESERYQYLYYPTARLRRAADTLRSASSVEDWVGRDLVSVFSDDEDAEHSVTPEEVLPLIPKLAAAMRRSASPLPITALSLGTSILLAEENRAAPMAAVRRAIEGISAKWPERARLSRGSYGDRAEFISIDTRDSSL
jgi:hypothetical protein